VRDWFRSFGGVEERAWFARDDVRPFLGMARQFALKALGRAARLGRRRAAAEDIADQQHRVNAYFASESSYWKRVYEENGVQAEIYQHRRSLVLDWIAQLGLPRGARILEVGCGAGLTAVELAQHGYLVDAIDSSDAMVELTRAHAAEAGVSERLRARTGDVHALAYEAASFDVVLAIGVLPWLHTPQAAIAELARVAKPGGYVLLTSDNRLRLVHLLDPRFNPALAPARRFVKASLRLLGYRPAANGPRSYLHAPRTVDRLVAAAGLNKARSTTLGFAPFTFLGKPALPRRLDSKVNGVLQALADRRVPVVRAAGSHYLVLAERSAER
jgi:ubiquinone/menaquinone biosynthesis C-methylase UbiE